MSHDLTIIERENALAKECNVDRNMYLALRDSIYPGASHQSIAMVLNYCRARNIDPLLKPVHITEISCKTNKRDSSGKEIYEKRDVIMPGIGLYRIDAARTGQYVGLSSPVFGPSKTERLGDVTITYPEWCSITVKRLVKGKVFEFPAHEFWKENYATKGKDIAPNAMWKKRPFGQLAKCAEAAALRKAFPEAIGDKEEGVPLELNEPRLVNNEPQEVVVQLQPIPETVNSDKDIFLQAIKFSNTLDELKEEFTQACRSNFRKDPLIMEEFNEAKNKRKQELIDAEEKAKIDSSWDEFKVNTDTGEIKTEELK